jgi:hypothetical protein
MKQKRKTGPTSSSTSLVTQSKGRFYTLSCSLNLQLALSDEAEGGDRTYVKQRVPSHNPKDIDEHARRDSSPGNNFLARGGFALAATMSPLIQKVGGAT